MLYRIMLDDNSYIIADDTYKLTIFKNKKKAVVSIKEYIENSKYWKYYLIDEIEGIQYKREFKIDYTDRTDLPINARFKNACDIKEGDLVLGEDGKPNPVEDLHSGNEDMYEIEVNGESYVVNGGHILALVDIETGEHIDLPVNIYLLMNDDFKSKVRMEMIKEA